MVYNRGGDVTSNTSKTDSVDAKLTPGEIVMNEMQQRRMKKQSGFDPKSFVPPAQPGKVKYASEEWLLQVLMLEYKLEKVVVE